MPSRSAGSQLNPNHYPELNRPTNNYYRNRHGLNDWIKEKQDKEDAENDAEKTSQ